MSSLYFDKDIEVLTVRLKTKADPSTDNIYFFANDYYAANQLYSGSPEVYPLLRGAIETVRKIGLNIGDRGQLRADLYSKIPLTPGGATLYDLIEENEFKNAIVRARYYPKANGALTTHSDARIKWTGIIDDISNSQDGIISIIGVEEFFPDKQLVYKLTQNDHTNLDDAYNGAIASLVFGKAGDDASGIIIDAPILDKDASGFNWKLFAGTYPQTGHDAPEVKAVFMAGVNRELSTKKWHHIDIGSAHIAGLENSDFDATASEVNIRDQWLAFKIDTNNTKCVSSAYWRLKRYGTITEDDGSLTCEIYKATYNSSLGTYTLDKSALGTSTVDQSSISNGPTGEPVYFNFEPPVILPNEHTYLCCLKWGNSSSTNYIVGFRGGSSTAAVDTWKLERTTDRDAPWISASNNIHAGAYNIIEETTSPLAITDKYRLMSFGLKDGSPNAYSGATSTNLQFRLAITGIEDSGGTTITSPADVIKTILTADGQFLGISEADKVDTSSFSAVKTSLAGIDMKLSIQIARESFALEVIRAICRQARIIFYETANGKLALHYPPTNLKGETINYIFTELQDGEDFRLISISESSSADLVNDINILHSPNLIDEEIDDFIEDINGTSKYKGAHYLKAGASYDGDKRRQAQATISQGLYGSRLMQESAEFIDSDERAKIMRDYYFDNYAFTRKIVKTAHRRDRYHGIDIFSIARLNHTAIYSKLSNSLSSPAFDDGTRAEILIDGAQSQSYSSGQLIGEIKEIKTIRSEIQFTTETRGAQS